jgi:XapX domain-containing protein
MKTALVSFVCGILVGCFYGVLKVQAPAPPFIPLIGLAGILMGQQIVPILRTLLIDHRSVITRSLALTGESSTPKQDTPNLKVDRR